MSPSRLFSLLKNTNLAVIVAFLSFSVLRGQENESAATLFKKGGPDSTSSIEFFMTPMLGITEFDGSTAFLIQARAGLTVNDTFSFGGYFSTSMNEIYPESETLSDIYMDYWSAGGFISYAPLSKKLINWSFPLYFGYGEIEMDNEQSSAGLGEANFFQIEPSALLHLNVTQKVRFTSGAGYRWVSDTTYRNLNQSNLSGLTGYLGLVFDL